MIKRILNKDQNPDNFLQMNDNTGCCGDDAPACQYQATYTQANSVSVLNVLDEKGAAKALPLTIGGGATAAAVQAALLAAIVAAGYEDDSDEEFPGVAVVDLGTTLQITITGTLPVVSLVASGGTSSFDADCKKANLCTFTLNTYLGGASGAAATDLYINGVAQNLGTVTLGTTSASTLQTAVNSALTAGGVLGTATVTANGSTSYNIVIVGSQGTNHFRIQTARFTRSACAPSYI